jgi:hypothetical protein
MHLAFGPLIATSGNRHSSETKTGSLGPFLREGLSQISSAFDDGCYGAKSSRLRTPEDQADSSSNKEAGQG